MSLFTGLTKEERDIIEPCLGNYSADELQTLSRLISRPKTVDVDLSPLHIKSNFKIDQVTDFLVWGTIGCWSFSIVSNYGGDDDLLNLQVTKLNEKKEVDEVDKDFSEVSSNKIVRVLSQLACIEKLAKWQLQDLCSN